MALAASLKLDGVTGTGMQKGREKDITVVGFRHEVKSDLGHTDGRPGGDRTHTHFVIQKNLDFATPELHEAYVEGRVFDSWTLKLFHMEPGGEHHYFSVALTKAKISSIKLVMPFAKPGFSDPDCANTHEYEEIGFSYEAIGWGSQTARNKDAAYSAYTSTDELVKFSPDWIQQKAFDAIEDMAGTKDAEPPAPKADESKPEEPK